MTTKAPRRPLVGFYTTSPLIAHACRSAVRHNRNLGRRAVIRDLGRLATAPDVLAHTHDLEMVVLSHADGHNRVLTDARVKRVVSGAFHLLLTEPATHPDQIAQWMNTAGIRAENRLHVVEVEDLEAPQVSQLLGRVCSALGRDGGRDSIIDAYLAGDTLLVRGPEHRMLHVPVSSVPALRGRSPAVLRNFTIDPDGSFLDWPELDVHLGWKQFLQAVEPAELWRSQQRSAAFNERYGAAIHRVRESAGILQSKVDGLTERQVRRIEHGECRATTAALLALAKAHGLDANDYMETLSKAMK